MVKWIIEFKTKQTIIVLRIQQVFIYVFRSL